MTSLAFMFVEVPEPVWKTSMGTARRACPRRSRQRRARSVWRSALAAGRARVDGRSCSLDAASQCTTARAQPRRRSGSSRPPCSSQRPTDVSLSGIYPLLWCALGRGHICATGAPQLRRANPTRRTRSAPVPGRRVVVGHQEAGARQHAQLPVGASARAPLRRLQRMHGSSATAAAPACPGAGTARAARSARRAASAWRISPTSERGWSCRHVGEGVANEVAAAGFARADRRRPRSGVNTRRSVGEQAVEAGQRSGCARSCHASRIALRPAAMQPVGHQHQPRRIEWRATIARSRISAPASCPASSGCGPRTSAQNAPSTSANQSSV